MEGLEESFRKTLLKFKFDEFPDMLPVVFRDSLPWERVTGKLDTLRLDRRVKSVAQVCCMLYKRTE